MVADFHNKTVIITGASKGVGKACTERFAALGARLVLVARGKKALKAVAESLGPGRDVVSVAMDVADTNDCADLFRKAEFEFGAVHVLINNAGFHERGAVEKLDADAMAQMVDVNLKAPIVLTRMALPYLRAAGGGAIVNVASLAGCTPVAGAATYSATKFGLRAFTQSLADELRGSGIHVGAVSPGPIDTGFIMSDIDSVSDITFSQPMSSAEQVADAVVRIARGERAEIKMPAVSGPLTTLSYLFPALRRALKPMLDKKGRKAKEFYRRRAAETER
ncbi:MAG: SDR family NAD(P)-dependent oxidoreductase [Pseudomonadota bacterium]